MEQFTNKQELISNYQLQQEQLVNFYNNTNTFEKRNIKCDINIFKYESNYYYYFYFYKNNINESNYYNYYDYSNMDLLCENLAFNENKLIIFKKWVKISAKETKPQFLDKCDLFIQEFKNYANSILLSGGEF